MDRHVFLALASLILAGGCDKKADGTSADDTRLKERDRGPTPLQQGNSQADLETTQRIRVAIMKEDVLSYEAKNIKIITSNGVVTLRGVVKDQAERAVIEEIARREAGPNRVDIQLEVPTPDTHRR
jgi:hyperosmotically inducible protein